jgi:hypothetical protein
VDGAGVGWGRWSSAVRRRACRVGLLYNWDKVCLRYCGVTNISERERILLLYLVQLQLPPAASPPSTDSAWAESESPSRRGQEYTYGIGCTVMSYRKPLAILRRLAALFCSFCSAGGGQLVWAELAAVSNGVAAKWLLGQGGRAGSSRGRPRCNVEFLA